MPPRIQCRWGTQFGSFISSYGVGELADALRQQGAPTTTSAIYSWVSGLGMPRPERIVALQYISGGLVTFQTIVEHTAAVRRGSTPR